MKLQRIIGFATLAISILTLVLVLRRPAPVAPAAAPAAAAANAQSFQEKVNRPFQHEDEGKNRDCQGCETDDPLQLHEDASAVASCCSLLWYARGRDWFEMT